MLLREPQGWLWFSSDPKKEDRVRIGVTDADPDTFLPPSVVLLYKQPVKDQKKATSDIESNLKEAKISGAWYDANSAQAYISHLRDEW